jgi:subtilisin family serine protease
VSFTGSVPATFRVQIALLGGKVEWVSTRAGLASVSGLSSAAASTLAGTKGIQQVAADQSFALDDPGLDASNVVSADATETQANPAGAFFFPRQWNMRAVGANLAWAAGFLGSSSVSVFILDTGIDYLNLDLNGLVDQSRSTDLLGTFTVGGVSFTERDTVTKYFPTRQPFTDLYFHGTHVGATVSSLALGAAGVTSRTELVAVKVCAYLNTCPFSSILNGVIYAADHGADVVNMSLGGGFSKAGNGVFVGLINKTFNYARSKGVTIVVAAGNAAADLDHNGNTYTTYCNTPSVICVSATGPTAQVSINGPWTDVDAPSYFTNFGSSAIDVAAPGGNNASFVWATCSRTSLLIPVCQTGNFFVGAQGTSMATPHVAGTAALLVPILGRDPAAIKDRILETADDLGASGTDPFYGKGRLNVARAVGAIP